MESSCGLLCIIVVVLLCLVQNSLQLSPIVMGPVDTEAAVGTDAVLYCKVRAGQGNVVYWIVGRSIAIGPLVNSNEALPRYEIFGNALQGYYNLRIRNVTLDDATRYDCLVDAQGDGSNYEAGATLDIVSTPLSPSPSPQPICLGATVNEIVMDEGEELTNYRCRSTGGVPLGELKWSLLRADQTLVDVDFDTQVDTSPSITATSSSYRLTADDHESQLACTLTHPSFTTEPTCTVPAGNTKISVRHFPIINFGPRIEVNYLEVKNATIRCTASSFPELITNIPELSFSDPEMLIATMPMGDGVVEALIRISQRSNVGERINCSARNTLGTTTATLEVHLTPVLPIWLLMVVLILACLIVLFFLLCCCYCFCNGCKPKSPDDHPDLGDIKAAGYDVNDSRTASVFQPNGLNGNDLRPIDDPNEFDDIPLNDYTNYPPPPPNDYTNCPPPPPTSEPTTVFNDHETGEVNDGYMSSNADERFPPMIEDEHLMGEKRLSTFRPDEGGPPPPPPPPPLDLDDPKPIPSVEDD